MGGRGRGQREQRSARRGAPQKAQCPHHGGEGRKNQQVLGGGLALTRPPQPPPSPRRPEAAMRMTPTSLPPPSRSPTTHTSTHPSPWITHPHVLPSRSSQPDRATTQSPLAAYSSSTLPASSAAGSSLRCPVCPTAPEPMAATRPRTSSPTGASARREPTAGAGDDSDVLPPADPSSLTRPATPTAAASRASAIAPITALRRSPSRLTAS